NQTRSSLVFFSSPASTDAAHSLAAPRLARGIAHRAFDDADDRPNTQAEWTAVKWQSSASSTRSAWHFPCPTVSPSSSSWVRAFPSQSPPSPSQDGNPCSNPLAAIWGWGVTPPFLHRRHIDVPALIRYPGRSNSAQATHHHSTYRLASFLSLTSALSIVTFWLFTRNDASRVIDYDWMPMTNLLVLAALFAIPLRRL